MNKSGKLLIVDDAPLVLRSLELLFEEEYDVTVASSGAEALEIVRRSSSFDAAILDIKMAKMDGLQTADRLKETAPHLPIIFCTGHPGEYEERQIEEKQQPFDYVTKQEGPVPLRRSVKNAVRMHQLQVHRSDLAKLARDQYGMIGQSRCMRGVYQLIEQVAPSDSKVVILGESGTGKELVARAIHARSHRAARRFAILNCNHKQAGLIDSELFGHVKGSFTGAVADRVGLFEYANGGTVFLDEIGDLDITTQAKLLRVLETGETARVGASEHFRVDVRLVCATHRDLQAMVRDKTFREDLYYRLQGVTILMPPLRERREDIPLLVDHFIEDHCRTRGDGIRLFDTAAIDMLVEDNWPGNVRQLQETVRALINLSISSYITRDQVADYLGRKSDAAGRDGSLSDRLQDHKKTLIIQALARNNRNISAAARDLQVDPGNLHRMIKQLGIDLV